MMKRVKTIPTIIDGVHLEVKSMMCNSWVLLTQVDNRPIRASFFDKLKICLQVLKGNSISFKCIIKKSKGKSLGGFLLNLD